MSHSKSMIFALALVLPLAVRAPAAELVGMWSCVWGSDLDSAKQEVRRIAALALGNMGIGDEKNLQKLADLLRSDRDAGVRDAAAAALGDVILATRGASAAYWPLLSPALRAGLKDDAPKVKRSAAYALGTFGKEAVSAIGDLKTALRDPAAIVRQNAAWALGRLGKEAGEETVDLLCDRLRDDDALVRRDSATALGDIGLPTAARAWKPLLDLVRSESQKPDPDDVLLRTALGKLTVLLDNQNKQIIDAVMPLMNANNPEEIQRQLREAIGPVLKNLGGIGLPDAKAARETALERYRTAARSGNLQPVVDALKSMEETGKQENNKLAAQLEPLTQLLRNEDSETAMLAAFALARIGGPPARPALSILQKTLKDPDPKVQEQAATFLGEMGPDAADAATALADALLPNHAGAVRARAAVALTKIGPDSVKVTRQLLEALRTEETQETREREVRKYIAEVFVQMGYPNTHQAMPTLLDVIARDTNVGVRHRCIWVFLNMDPKRFPEIDSASDRRSAEQVLTTVLSDGSLDSAPVVRYDAARALAFNLGERAPKKAADELLHMLSNDKLYVYQGTEARVTTVGREGDPGTTRSDERKGGDARFMAAQALGMMGKTAADHPGVVETLRKAQKDKIDTTGRLQLEAEKALKLMGVN